ncbi:unnamed protein product, partial [Heligmosomoides polygyrus]|uniref:DUF1758 domain-containing protein n=1 Tax=Heligmosomoides polygyrus TaxID=6339 RepID=A0A183GTD1_HELPZ
HKYKYDQTPRDAIDTIDLVHHDEIPVWNQDARLEDDHAPPVDLTGHLLLGKTIPEIDSVEEGTHRTPELAFKISQYNLGEFEVITITHPQGKLANKALIYNFNAKADQCVTILLDSGSQHSFISKNIAEARGLTMKHPKDIITITFGGHEHTEKSYRVTAVLRNPVTGTPVKLKLWTRTHITSIPEQMNTDHTVPPKGSSEIDILIGMDYYWSVINLNHNEKLPSGLVQSQTKLGPIISGPSIPSFYRVLTTSVEFENPDKTVDAMVRRLCALDSENMEEDRDINQLEIIQQYYDTVQVINGLIHVQFPWKVKYPHLPDNKALALRRLESQRVYAAVAYLVCRPLNNSKPFSNIIYAKTRIETPEKSTVPRLELQAIVLAAKMTRFLLKDLTIRVHSIHWLSDSQIALYWIHSKKQLKTFVQNRVKLIHEVIDELTTANIKCRPYILRPIDLLTPNFSLGHLGTPLETVTTKDLFSSSDSKEHLIQQYRTLRESLNMFWDIWHKEYLRAVAERNQIRLAKRESSSKQPQIGDIVFIEMDNAGRSQWPLGVVIELNKSSDGAIRSINKSADPTGSRRRRREFNEDQHTYASDQSSAATSS